VEEMVNIKIPLLEDRLVEIGAPWIEGQPIPKAND
jgi:hypothetical protein